MQYGLGERFFFCHPLNSTSGCVFIVHMYRDMSANRTIFGRSSIPCYTLYCISWPYTQVHTYMHTDIHICAIPKRAVDTRK